MPSACAAANPAECFRVKAMMSTGARYMMVSAGEYCSDAPRGGKGEALTSPASGERSSALYGTRNPMRPRTASKAICMRRKMRPPELNPSTLPCGGS